jgi:hypothetical protein
MQVISCLLSKIKQAARVTCVEPAIRTELLEELNRGNRDLAVTNHSKPARHHHPQIENLYRIMVQTLPAYRA